MSATPARRHTRMGLAHTATSTGRRRSACDVAGQPDPNCPCGACQRWERGTRPVPSTDLARSVG